MAATHARAKRREVRPTGLGRRLFCSLRSNAWALCRLRNRDTIGVAGHESLCQLLGYINYALPEHTACPVLLSNKV
jgi:hypothetical protein